MSCDFYKTHFFKARFTVALLQYRIRELERFLYRVAAHPVLREEAKFRCFVEASSQVACSF